MQLQISMLWLLHYLFFCGPWLALAKDGPPLWLRSLHSEAASNASQTNHSAAIAPLTMSSGGESYYAVLQVGLYNYRVALDTGSSDLWMVSSDCTTKICEQVPRFPLDEQSPTFQSVEGNSTQFGLGYADGTTATGFIGKESVKFGTLNISDQALGFVSQTNVSLSDEISGILGLGFSRLSTTTALVNQSTPFFTRLAQQGLLQYPLFGLSLTRDDTGSFSIGAIDKSVVTNVSQIVWSSVVEFAPFTNESSQPSYLHWAIPMGNISFGDIEITPSPTFPNITKNTSLALIDIGASGFSGPFKDVSRLFDAIPDSRLVSDEGIWAIPCATNQTMTFTFGGHKFILQPTDYLIAPVSGNPTLCLSWPRGLSPSVDGLDWHMGSAFLRTVYSVFSYGINDKEPPMIGFYPLYNSTNSTESPANISSFFSSISATIATTLPNSLLPTPDITTTPSYVFNSSVHAPTGGTVSTALATSTYSPILAGATNLSALPLITAGPTAVTLTITDEAGSVETSVSFAPSIIIGMPGWDSGSSRNTPALALYSSLLLIIWWAS